MKIYYDKEKSAELEQKLIDKWFKTEEIKGKYRIKRDERVAKRGKEFHVSDVVCCPLETYCRLLKLKRKFSKKSIALMLFGIVAQKLIQWLYPDEDCEYEAMIPDIVIGHVDVFEDQKHPMEIKATRKRIFKRDQIPQKWVEQLACYMAMTSSKIGWLIILNIFSCQVSCFCIEMTDEDVLGQLVLISTTVNERRRAANLERPTMLRPSAEQYEHCNYKRNCPRRADCKRKFDEIQKRKEALSQRKKNEKKPKSPLDEYSEKYRKAMGWEPQ